MLGNRFSFFYFIILLSFTSAEAANIECRKLTGSMTTCNPYTHKVIHAKEIRYEHDKKKLIVDKTLPLTKRKKKMRVISVADMFEKQVKVQEPLRYKGSKRSPYGRATLTPNATLKKERFLTVDTKKEKIQTAETSPPKKTKISTKVLLPKLYTPQFGQYKVKRGDTLNKIAHQLHISAKELAQINQLNSTHLLKIGQTLKIPMLQEKIDSYISGEYLVKQGDTLIGIAKVFDLDPKALTKFNHITSNTMIRAGKKIKLPLPHIIKALKKKEKEAKRRREMLAKKSKRVKMLRPTGKHKLRVTATAYTSHRKQTDKTPFVAAWNNRLRPGMRIIAVSRDLLSRYGMRNGTKVRIGGLPGYYVVRDKMNKRFRRRIDIYMGKNRRRALKWGKRSVIISW